jgi:hypothetical protein
MSAMNIQSCDTVVNGKSKRILLLEELCRTYIGYCTSTGRIVEDLSNEYVRSLL